MKKYLKINRAIRSEKVRVISEDGGQIGVLSTKEAIRLAEEKGLDLIEISPNANPPVCKIIDYGKFRYQKTKKEKESKKGQHQVKIKEIKLRPNIDVHDLNTKINRAKKFLGKGNKVRITCMFRGREMLHIDLGEKLLNKIIEDLEDIAILEAPFKFMGRILTIVLAPRAKK
jgi:translation initiation factor IF-3